MAGTLGAVLLLLQASIMGAIFIHLQAFAYSGAENGPCSLSTFMPVLGMTGAENTRQLTILTIRTNSDTRDDAFSFFEDGFHVIQAGYLAES